jgi:tetratricopeptide (TPR) repeat protein
MLRRCLDVHKDWHKIGEYHVLIGLLYLYTNNLTMSEQVLSKAITLAQDCSWGYFLRFSCRTLLARRDKNIFSLLEAAPDLEIGLKLDPSNIIGLALRAELLHDRELADNALVDIEKILSIDPGSDWARSERGEIFTEIGNWKKAVKDFNCLVGRYPQLGWPYALRARAKANSGQLASAVIDFDQAVLYAEPHIRGAVLAWRAETLRKLGLHAKATRGFDEAIRVSPNYMLAYAWRGRYRLMRGDLIGSVNDLTKAINKDPRHVLLYAWRAEAFIKSGNYLAASRDLDWAYPFHIRNSWNRPPGQQDAKRDFLMESELERAITLHPRSAWLRALKGRLMLDSQKQPNCLNDFTKALNLQPKFSLAISWRGEAHRRAGCWKEAAQDFKQALAWNKSCFWAYFGRARLYLDMSAWQEAISDLDIVLNMRPDIALAYRWRAEAFLNQGMSNIAVNDIGRSLFLNSKDVDTHQLMRKCVRALGQR